MDHDLTQPMPGNASLLYRCSCGNEVRTDLVVGGTCIECGKLISPKMLRHELAMTMTIHGGQHVDLDQTRVDAGQGNEPDLLVGQTLGHFEIISSLGRGGMGQVYRALDKSLQRYVAVKVLRSGIGSTEITSSSDREIDMLLQEAVSQARVTHPNIATIYYVGKESGAPFLAMELIDGAALSDKIQSGGMPFQEIGPIALQVAQALKFSYQLDIIHGDIKPSNILIQASGSAKLSDFGMARRASANESEAVGGTPNYLAPELLAGQKPSIQSDMYALGVTLYEMTFGRIPIQLSGATLPEWINSHRESVIKFPKPWPPHLPEDWRLLLDQLLAKDPADRYQNYDQLLTDLLKLQPDSKVPARRAPRMIAATIDTILVFLLMVPTQIITQIPWFKSFFNDHPLVALEIRLLFMIPILGYLAMVFLWRQSPGRELMHIRVVNRYGLQPTPRWMVYRELLRMSLAWAIAISIFSDPFNVLWLDIVFAVVVGGLLLFTLINLGFLIFYQYGRALHDQIFKTTAVIGAR